MTDVYTTSKTYLAVERHCADSARAAQRWFRDRMVLVLVLVLVMVLVMVLVLGQDVGGRTM